MQIGEKRMSWSSGNLRGLARIRSCKPIFEENVAAEVGWQHIPPFSLWHQEESLLESVVVANSAFANLSVQSVWPAVLYIAFSWHVDMWPSSTTHFSICNVISRMTTLSLWKTLREMPLADLFMAAISCPLWELIYKCLHRQQKWIGHRPQCWSSVATDAHTEHAKI